MGNGSWTLDSLKEHLETLIRANDRRYEQRFADQEAAVKAALAAAEKAKDKAEVEAERWRAQANEWRSAMLDRERTFIPRLEAEQRFEAMLVGHRVNEEKVSEVKNRLDRSESRRGGQWSGWGWLVAAVGLVGTLIGIFAFVFRGR